MNNLNSIYMADNHNLCFVVSKICVFAPDWERKFINIYVENTEDNFQCIYNTKEEMNCALQRLEAIIQQRTNQ